MSEALAIAGSPATSAAAGAAIGAGLELVQPPPGEDELNLDYAATTPALRGALDAVTGFVPGYASVHRGGGRRSALATEAYESARRAVAEFVGCPSGSSVVFVRNTTEAANLLAAALPPGSHVCCTPFEHHANLLPWRAHAVGHLPFTSSPEELLTAVERELVAAKAAGSPIDLLAVSGASNVTGEVAPLRALAAAAHAHGALIFVDAAQLAPHRPIDLVATGADFLAFSGHKLYAPFGTGALVVRDEALADGVPLLRGGGAVRLVSLERVAWAALPHRYEAGTPNTVGAIALGAACRALSAYGMARIAADEQRLAELLWQGLTKIPRVELLRMWDATADRVGVATFAVEGLEARAVAEELATDFGIAVRSGAFCAHPLVAHLLGVTTAETDARFAGIARGEEVRVPGAVRASIGIGVRPEDIERLLSALTILASRRSGGRL